MTRNGRKGSVDFICVGFGVSVESQPFHETEIAWQLPARKAPELEHLNVHSEWERSDLGIPECLTFISVHMGNNCEYTIHSYFL